MKVILFFASIALIISCGQQGGNKSEKSLMSDYQAYVYESTMDKVKSLEGRMSDLSSASFEEVEKYLQDVDGVKYHNDTTDMTASGIWTEVIFLQSLKAKLPILITL